MMGQAIWLVAKVVIQQLSEEPRSVYTHCYRYALNLAVGNVMKKSRFMGDILNTTSEISKLLKYFLH